MVERDRCRALYYSTKNLIAINDEESNDKIGDKNSEDIENRRAVGREAYMLTWG
jgi:hypothetical protein